MTLSHLNKRLPLAAIAVAFAFVAFPSPSMAFNPQPDPPGKVRVHNPQSEKAIVIAKGPVKQAKPDCKTRNKQNPCI